MLILFSALIFGIVVMIFLIRSMSGRFSDEIHGTGGQKARAIIKLVLLIEVIVYILIFIVIIIKTLFL